MTEHPFDHPDLSMTEPGDSPLHGYRGAGRPAPTPGVPASLSVAISREAGSRGLSIAKRAGEKLGWDVYTQDLLEFICQDPSVRRDLLDKLTPAATGWIEEQLGQLRRDHTLASNSPMQDLARLVLALASQGNVILLGRGAGFLLPEHSTLHVRLVAPLADRIAYLSQWLRLTDEEAAEQVRQRDLGRCEFLATHFGRKPSDVHAYDIVLNSSLLGEDRCADLIVAAARLKASALASAS